jgi:hypothetical protein
MARAIEYAPIHLILEEVAVHDGDKVLPEVDDNISFIVNDPQMILDQQLSGLYYKCVTIIIDAPSVVSK